MMFVSTLQQDDKDGNGKSVDDRPILKPLFYSYRGECSTDFSIATFDYRRACGTPPDDPIQAWKWLEHGHSFTHFSQTTHGSAVEVLLMSNNHMISGLYMEYPQFYIIGYKPLANCNAHTSSPFRIIN